MKMVYAVGTWPENNYEDFQVFAVKEGETDEQALERAAKYYDEELYIKEI